MISLPLTLIAPLPLFAVALRKVARALLSVLTHGNETALEPRKHSPWRPDAAGSQFTRTIYQRRRVDARKTARRKDGGKTVNMTSARPSYNEDDNSSLASFRGKVYFFLNRSGCFYAKACHLRDHQFKVNRSYWRMVSAEMPVLPLAHVFHITYVWNLCLQILGLLGSSSAFLPNPRYHAMPFFDSKTQQFEVCTILQYSQDTCMYIDSRYRKQ